MRVVWTNHAKDRARRRLRKSERTIPNTAVHRAFEAWDAGDKIRINIGRAQFVCRVTGEGLVVITVLRRGE